MKQCAVALCLAIVVAALPLAVAGTPGNSNAFGNSLDEWMELYWTWLYGGDQEGRVGKVVFLPLPAADVVSEDPLLFGGTETVTLKPGEKFVLPIFAWLGETYTEESGLPPDDPDDVPLEVFTSLDVEIRIDGKTIIDDADGNLDDYVFDFTFENPIVYDEPSSYGSTSIIWGRGIGFVHGPLPPGEHTIDLYVYSDFFGAGYQNHWDLTVSK